MKQGVLWLTLARTMFIYMLITENTHSLYRDTPSNLRGTGQNILSIAAFIVGLICISSSTILGSAEATTETQGRFQSIYDHESRNNNIKFRRKWHLFKFYET